MNSTGEKALYNQKYIAAELVIYARLVKQVVNANSLLIGQEYRKTY